MKQIIAGFSLVLFLAAFTVGIPAANEPKNPQYRVPRVDSSIKANGVMDEDVWKQALTLEIKYEVRPAENIPAPVKTEVLIAYNKTHLFVGFRAYDPEPSKIRAFLSDRDNIDGDDWVLFLIDTFNDERRSYDFMCNPLGVQSEFIETNGGDGGSWDAIWDSGGRITDWGYCVEMSIPFSSLRFQRKNGDQIWGFDAIRSYPRNVRHHLGSFKRDRSNNCYLCQSIKLIGFKEAKPGKNLEFDPTLSVHLSREREDTTSGPFVGDQQYEAGLTARWGFTNNLTLSATVNPDFSQVEADAPQMDINEPFALFYPEKRPFFQEGSDFFDTRLNAVYTRTMRDPSWGLKVTGKEGANTIGAYMVRDTLTNLIFPGSQGSDSTSMDIGSTSSVLRYKRDFGNKYTAGVLFTNREGTDYFNRVYGFDGDFRFTSTDRLRLQILGSSTSYPGEVAEEFGQPGGTFNDKAFEIQYSHNTRNWDAYAGYKDIGKNFRADLGFIPKVGYRRFFVGGDLDFYPRKTDKWFTHMELEGFYEQQTDYDGDLLSRFFNAEFTYEGPLNTHARLEYTRRRDLYNGKYFDQNVFHIHNCMHPDGKLAFHVNMWFGDRIDYANTRLAKRFRVGSGFSYKFGKHIKTVVRHTYERLAVEGEKLYTANQSEFQLVYQFDRRMFIRGIVQYIDYRYNQAMYVDTIDPVYKHLLTQFLFSYKINPQTVLFLGYSDNYYGYYDIRGLPLSNQMVFLKVGYALVL